jgi:hypothetical protein
MILHCLERFTTDKDLTSQIAGALQAQTLMALAVMQTLSERFMCVP